MAARYWVGGTGSWTSTAHWSTSSGGAGGASVPTSSDDVTFDGSSGPGSTVIDMNGVSVHSLTIKSTVAAGFNLSTHPSSDLDIYGDFVIEAGSGIVFDTELIIRMQTTGSIVSLNTNGVSIGCALQIWGTGLCSVISDVNVASPFTFSLNDSAGTVNFAAGVDVTAYNIDIYRNKVVTFGNGCTFNPTALQTDAMRIGVNGTGGSVTDNGATINLNGNGLWMDNGARSLNKIYAQSGSCRIRGENSDVGELRIAAGATLNIEPSGSGYLQVRDVLVVEGAATMQSSSAGVFVDFRGNGASVAYDVNDLSVKDIHASNGTWRDHNGTDVSGNVGWTFLAGQSAQTMLAVF